MASAASVAVVGGGLAGLSAAADLKRAGARVDLFERSRLLGGRATSFEIDGHVVDNGQHVYLACCAAFVHFVECAGMGSALYLQERFDVAVYSKNGKRSRLRAANLPAPLHLLASFASYKYLSVAGKLQIARALASLKFRPESASEGISFAQWLRDHGQSAQTIRAFWQPFMVPALNAPLHRMNAAEAAFVVSTAFLHDRGAARFGYSTVPLARIMEAAAAGLDGVHRSSAVHEIVCAGGAITVKTARAESHYDAAVLAVSPESLARLLPRALAEALPPLDAYEPFAIMDVHLWYDGPALDADFAAILDSPVQWVFQKARGYLCCSISVANDLAKKTGAEMTELAWAQVCAALPLRGARLLRGAATRNPAGTYLPPPGTQRPGPRTALRNLTLAGAWTATGWPDTMESAVQSGRAAAAVLLESLADAR
ncbi:MAG: hydroxysqualene dehydroxylase HpnE [Candidatus Baltobacteraceae bacterium]